MRSFLTALLIIAGLVLVAAPAAAQTSEQEEALELTRDERRQIQSALADAGFYTDTINGLFGRQTRAAIRAWQASRGEPETGYLDADGAIALLELDTAPTPDPGVPGATLRDCDECPELVVVPAGSFMMGSPSSEEGRDDDEGPPHRVTIGAPFAVGIYEVTFAEWGACVRAGGCGGYRPSDLGWGRGTRPVINVSWEDAQGYVRWLSRRTGNDYRLLSEAEWEYVARAGTTTARYWVESETGQCRHANGADLTAKRQNDGWTVADCDDGYYRTAPVGSYTASRFGLYDVLGNVWEWTRDCWNASYAGAPTDGSAWERGVCSRRVVRGGSWDSLPSGLRSAYRGRDSTGDRNGGSGFRVARTLTS